MGHVHPTVGSERGKATSGYKGSTAQQSNIRRRPDAFLGERRFCFRIHLNHTRYLVHSGFIRRGHNVLKEEHLVLSALYEKSLSRHGHVKIGCGQKEGVF